MCRSNGLMSYLMLSFILKAWFTSPAGLTRTLGPNLPPAMR